MGRNDNKKTLVLVALVISVLGLSVGFAAFTQNLKITSNVAVTPDAGNFKIRFSKNSSSVENGTISPSSGTGSSATILDTTISGLHANFTAPGQSVEYSFYALNTGDYKAYLTDVLYNNILNQTAFKKCTAGEGATSSLVETACNGIKVEVKVGSDTFTTTNSSVSNHVLEKSGYEQVKVTIKYESGYVDGPFEVEFGNIVLSYSTVETGGGVVSPTTPTTICTPVTSTTLGNVPTGTYQAGDKYTCFVNDTTSYNFYILNTEGNNVNMIMDHDLTTSEFGDDMEATYGTYATVNYFGPTTVFQTLNTATSSWTNVPNINFNYTDEGNSGYTITTTGNNTVIKDTNGSTKLSLTNLKARLPKYSEVSNYSSSANNGYLYDNLTAYKDATSEYIYGLEQNLNNGSTSEGYWTLSTTKYSNTAIAFVSYFSMLSERYSDTIQGVRPVITLPKTMLG